MVRTDRIDHEESVSPVEMRIASGADEMKLLLSLADKQQAVVPYV
jgi:hypothetical protein